MRRILGRLFGYAWTSRLGFRRLVFVWGFTHVAAAVAFGAGLAATQVEGVEKTPPAGMGALAFAIVAVAALGFLTFSARFLLRVRFPVGRPPAVPMALRAMVPGALWATVGGAALPYGAPLQLPFATLFAVAGANLLFAVAVGAPVLSRPSESTNSS